MPTIKPRLLLGLMLAILLVTSIGALQQFTIQGRDSGTYLGQYSSLWGVTFLLIGLLAVIELVLLIASLTRPGSRWLLAQGKKLEGIRLPAWLCWTLGLVPAPVLIWLVFWKFNDNLGSPMVRQWLFWLCVIAGAFFVWRSGRFQQYFSALVVTTLLYGVAFNVAALFTPVSGYPFSLDWSEGSRYYNASLFFAQSLYGHKLPLPVLHPSRYMLQSLAFLIPGAGIAIHRLWQALLWFGMTLLGSYAVVRRMKLGKSSLAWMAMGWSFVFLLSGPVYYHLVPCAALVLLGFDRHRPWQTSLMVLLASVWAGLSRLNWFPVPGLMAAMLFLLETRLEPPLWKYLWKPAAWTVAGSGLAYATSLVYKNLSGNPPEVFGSALDSPLLWNRLLPNPTYPEGLLLSMLILFLPLLFVFVIIFRNQLRAWHPLRILGVAGILGVFLAGGVVVSVKVGGGSNLHNMDAFMVYMLVVLAYLISRQAQPDHPVQPVSLQPAYWALLLVFLINLTYVFIDYKPVFKSTPENMKETFNRLQASLDRLKPGDEVLFINERQFLLTEPYRQLNFEDRYELVFLMEMVMSGNRAYLDQFHQDLAMQRYKLIIVETPRTRLQDNNKAFSEENNLWVEEVSLPILKYYRTRTDFMDIPVAIMEPIP